MAQIVDDEYGSPEYELRAARHDAAVYGCGYIVDGERVDPSKVRIILADVTFRERTGDSSVEIPVDSQGGSPGGDSFGLSTDPPPPDSVTARENGRRRWTDEDLDAFEESICQRVGNLVSSHAILSGGVISTCTICGAAIPTRAHQVTHKAWHARHTELTAYDAVTLRLEALELALGTDHRNDEEPGPLTVLQRLAAAETVCDTVRNLPTRVQRLDGGQTTTDPTTGTVGGEVGKLARRLHRLDGGVTGQGEYLGGAVGHLLDSERIAKGIKP